MVDNLAEVGLCPVCLVLRCLERSSDIRLYVVLLVEVSSFQSEDMGYP
jgi:hypothetical protein